MQGFFSEEALEQCEALLAKSYDYARCVKPDGTTYGTAGKCRKGVEISKVETGVFSVTDAEGEAIGSIRTEVGGGAVTTRNGRSTARYTASVSGKGEKQGLTLAQAKAWVRDQLGEKTGGDAKVAIKGGLTEKGKKRRIANLDAEIEEIRSDFNAKVKKWNAIPKEERRNNPNLKKNIEYLKTQYEALTAERKQIQDIPVVDHSEGNAYDFTRCVRPDGSAYGTGGKCRKGTEQSLFESDGGIQTGASGGVIGGKLFGANAPIKIETKDPTKVKSEPATAGKPGGNLYKGLKQSIADSRKLGFARNKKKVESVLEQTTRLLNREEELWNSHRAIDNAYSSLYYDLNVTLKKIATHGTSNRDAAETLRQRLLKIITRTEPDPAFELWD